jgi:hypothetical protein
MPRPNFLTAPGVWIRTPRTDKSAVEQACSIQHVTVSRGDRMAGAVLAVVIGIVSAALLAHWAAA